MATTTLELPSAQLPDAPAHEPHHAEEKPWRPRINPWIVAMTVTLATFMEVLDSSIANVALPHIAGGLGATQDEATWVLTAYLVANAIILPAGAYMTTFIGRKKFYMICVALFGITFGSLEFVLDKGQEDDWFSSHLITFFTVAMIVAFVAMIWWELKQLREGHRPILNLTLFKRRNFSISFLLMFVLGFSLYGTTILIPQLVQTLLGYTAELAGLVLSPAGLMMMCMMPVVGFLVGRVDPRKLIAYGFVMLTISLITMHTMDLSVSYGRLVFLRCFQASGLAFLFIPINTIAYIGVKQSEK